MAWNTFENSKVNFLQEQLTRGPSSQYNYCYRKQMIHLGKPLGLSTFKEVLGWFTELPAIYIFVTEPQSRVPGSCERYESKSLGAKKDCNEDNRLTEGPKQSNELY